MDGKPPPAPGPTPSQLIEEYSKPPPPISRFRAESQPQTVRPDDGRQPAPSMTLEDFNNIVSTGRLVPGYGIGTAGAVQLGQTDPKKIEAAGGYASAALGLGQLAATAHQASTSRSEARPKNEGRESASGLSASYVFPSGRAFRTPGGRPIATLEQRSPAVIVSEPPGEVGVMIPRRLTPTEMWSLQKEFGVEFALVYRTGMGRGGRGGTYWLYSGSVAGVRPPIGPNIRLISYTHLKGGDYGPSEQDLGFLRDLRKAGSPQNVSAVIEHDMNVITFGQPRPKK